MRERAILLDRDGTLVHPRHYPSRPEDLCIYDGITPHLRELQSAGFRLVVITNQAGIARGYLTEADLEQMHAYLTSELAKEGVRLDAIYYCPHHVEGVIKEYARSCDCRKPQPGMLLQAAADLNLDLRRSWFVGDILDDVEAGNRAGCRTVLVDLGTEPMPNQAMRTPHFVARDTRHALRIIKAVECSSQATDFTYRPLTWRKAEELAVSSSAGVPQTIGYQGDQVELVRQFRQLRALVIGDAMLDTYVEGTAARLCSEGPVPVVSKTAERRIPGGAANTAANLRALGAEVDFLSITGRDMAGALLRSALRAQGIDDRWMVEDAASATLHKLRILADGQYVVRLDEGAPSFSLEGQERVLAHLEETFSRCDVIVISDYCYGTLSDALIERLRALHRARPCPLLVDSKNLPRFRDLEATVVTPNYEEARLFAAAGGVVHVSAPGSEREKSEVADVGRRLLALLNVEYAAITLAEEGVFLIDRRGGTRHVPTHPVGQANDIGAGDSFASAMALALGAGGTMEEAARIANDAASIAVSKRWTATVSHQELLQRVSLREHAARFISETREAASTEALTALLAHLEVERARGQTIVFTNGVFDILHAGHIQFLRQARALGDMLVVAINSDASARRLKGKNRPINSERDRAALVAALDPVDFVVLFDEDTPVEMIRLIRPAIHVKGGDYADEALPEAEAVREVGGRIVILPLAGSISTSSVIDRILVLASANDHSREVEQ